MNAEGNQGAIQHPARLYRCRSTEVAVFSLHLAAPPFYKEFNTLVYFHTDYIFNLTFCGSDRSGLNN